MRGRSLLTMINMIFGGGDDGLYAALFIGHHHYSLLDWGGAGIRQKQIQ